MTPDDPDYRLGVGVMLIARDGRVFVANRNDTEEDAWQMPQGGIDRGEDPRAAAIRELKEETGTDRAAIVAESAGWLTYDLPAELAARVWGGRYRGQKQKWYAARFLGADEDIDLHGHDHPEFTEWRWVAVGDLIGLIVPFKRDLYRDVVAEFRDYCVPA